MDPRRVAGALTVPLGHHRRASVVGIRRPSDPDGQSGCCEDPSWFEPVDRSEVNTMGVPAVPTVLIVDDEMDMRTIVRLVLESANRGIRVVAEAIDGVDALTVFESLDRPEVPDVVILDNRMPGRTGVEVAEEIRKLEPDQPIILYSAFITPELEDRAREAGIDRCVSKVDYDTLPDVVLELAGQSSA